MEENKTIEPDISPGTQIGVKYQNLENEERSSEEMGPLNEILLPGVLSKDILETPTSLNTLPMISPISNFEVGVGCTSTPLTVKRSTMYSNKLKGTKVNLSTINEEKEDTLVETGQSGAEASPKNTKIFSHEVNKSKNSNIPPQESVVGKGNLNATVIYCHIDEKNMDDEELETTKIDEYSILFEKKEMDELNFKDNRQTHASTAEMSTKEQKPKYEGISALTQLKGLNDIVGSGSKRLKIFTSNDENENKDNENPKWEDLKKITTDEERYNVVWSRWQNFTIPNPKANLSSLNWRKKNSLSSLCVPKRKGNTYKLKKILTVKGGGSCISIFQKVIEDAKSLYSSKYELASRKLNEEMLVLLWQHSLEFQNCQMSYFELNYKHKLEMENLTAKYHEHFSELALSYNERLLNLNNAIKETERVYQFYDRLHNSSGSSSSCNSLYVEKEELQYWADIEHTIDMYNEYYH